MFSNFRAAAACTGLVAVTIPYSTTRCSWDFMCTVRGGCARARETSSLFPSLLTNRCFCSWPSLTPLPCPALVLQVVFVVRDGRDLATATSFNRDSVDMFAKLMAAPAEGPDAVRVWGSVNRQVRAGVGRTAHRTTRLDSRTNQALLL